MDSWIHVPGFTMDSWIHDDFLDPRWDPGFMKGSWIRDGFLDSWWVPAFTLGSWHRARHCTEVFGTARIIRARHGNPPPPVKGGTGVFLTRHETSESSESSESERL